MSRAQNPNTTQAYWSEEACAGSYQGAVGYIDEPYTQQEGAYSAGHVPSTKMTKSFVKDQKSNLKRRDKYHEDPKSARRGEMKRLNKEMKAIESKLSSGSK